MRFTKSHLLLGLALATTSTTACDQLGGSSSRGELTRAQCVEMVLKIDNLRNKEMGRAASASQRHTVDGCMAHGTKAQFECVKFANNGVEVARCDDLAK